MASEEMDNGGQMRTRRGIDSKGGSQLCFTECECWARDDFKKATPCRDGQRTAVFPGALKDNGDEDLECTPACTARHTTSANAA